MKIVVADIGGTHARFAIADIDGESVALGPETVLRTSDYNGFPSALRAFAETIGQPLPTAAGIAVAAPIDGDVVRLTNNDWIIRRDELGEHVLVNDFAAVAHAVSICDAGHFRTICGPDGPLPQRSVVSIIGPGTGLGVALLHRTASGDHVIATEGGHMDFAPLDETDALVLEALRRRHGRVSIERAVSGAGLAAIHAALTGEAVEDRLIWTRALAGEESAGRSLDRFCMILGSVAGDLALAHGAAAVVIAGGLGLRLADYLPGSGFRDRFIAKGRYRDRMAALPVKLIDHPQPGLLGAATAFLARGA